MATYDELLQAAESAPLRNRIKVACIMAAGAIRIEDGSVMNHAYRMLWAKAVFANPIAEADRMLWAVLAQKSDETLAQITEAADATIQAAVDAAVDVFATGS